MAVPRAGPVVPDEASSSTSRTSDSIRSRTRRKSSSGSAFGSGNSQSSRVFAGRCGHASPQPIVTRKSHRTPGGRSSSPFEACCVRSIPRSRMKAIARGLTWPDGREPALYVAIRPPPRARAKPSAI